MMQAILTGAAQAFGLLAALIAMTDVVFISRFSSPAISQFRAGLQLAFSCLLFAAALCCVGLIFTPLSQ